MGRKYEYDWEKIDAIRRMMNAPDWEKITLSTGEIIRPWDLMDERGNQIGIEEINTEMMLIWYRRQLEWNCPEEYK